MKLSTTPLTRVYLSLALLLVLTLAFFGSVSSAPQNPQITSSGRVFYTRQYLHIIYENGGTYYSADPDGAVEHFSSDASNVVNWAIAASHDYASILLRDGVYVFESRIRDSEKDGITIEGESWNSIIFVEGSLDGFRIEGQRDWVFRNFKIVGTKTPRVTPGFENAHIRLVNTRNVLIEEIWSQTANGYSIRLADTSAPTYNVGIKILNNLLEDPGHNCICAAGLNDSRMEGNTMIKYDYGLDMELVWIGGHVISGIPVGSFRNDFLQNKLTGGSIAVSLACYNTQNMAYIADNVVSGNIINSSQSTYPIIYVRGWYNNITENTINDLNTARTSFVVTLVADAGDTPNELRGNRVDNNTIYHLASTAIGAWNNMVYGGSISYNRIRGTPSGKNSISVNHPSSDYITCVGNVVRRTINIAGNNHGTEANNTENAPD